MTRSGAPMRFVVSTLGSRRRVEPRGRAGGLAPPGARSAVQRDVTRESGVLLLTVIGQTGGDHLRSGAEGAALPCLPLRHRPRAGCAWVASRATICRVLQRAAL